MLSVQSVSADGADVSGAICFDGVLGVGSAAVGAVCMQVCGLFHIFAYTPIRWGYSVDIPLGGMYIQFYIPFIYNTTYIKLHITHIKTNI